MSKLAKAIDYEVADDSVNLCKVREYKIGAKMEAKALLSEVDPDRDQAIKKIKRAIIEEVFGEFRPMIYDLHTVLYDRDTEQAVKILNELEHVMFYEGLEGMQK